MRIVCIQSPAYDMLTATLIQGLLELGHTIYASEDSNYASRSPISRLKTVATNADLIIVFSNDRVRLTLLDKIDNPNVVFVDGSDSQYFQVPNQIRFKAVFKRELHKYWINSDNEPIFPLPFAAERRYFSRKVVAKDIDLSFVATMHTCFRQSVETFLKSRKGLKVVLGTLPLKKAEQTGVRGLPRESSLYRDVLARSRVSVNVIGGGYDCGRYWEIPASKALLLSQQLDIIIPDAFVDGVHCLSFSTLEGLGERLDNLFSSSYMIDEIQEAGYEHLLAHHTCAARASYFISKVSNLDKNLFCDSFYTDKNTSKIKLNFNNFFKRLKIGG
jgi:hypothetical protein